MTAPKKNPAGRRRPGRCAKRSRRQLRLHEEFLVELAENAAAALEIAKHHYFDILVLDVGLPDMDGRELCRLMRRNGVRAPIVMLTGADSEARYNPGV